MTARRQKGLCYNCDEKWSQGHRCKAKFQCVLMEPIEEGAECDEECNEGGNTEQQPDDVEFTTGEEETPKISYHALRGHFVASTLRLKGRVSGKPVTVLVDSGSTHNFVQTRVAKQWKLAIETTNNLNVTIGDGSELHCQGKSIQVPIKLGDVVFEIDLFVLPIYVADIVLGAHWLAELGTVTFNY